MPYKSKQRQLPYRTFAIAGRPLRQFRVNGQSWYPIYDIIPLLETSRNATQVARSLPPEHVMKLQLTKRPPTNMINAHGLAYLIERAPNAEVEGTRAYTLARWAQSNLVFDEPDDDSLSSMISALQGELKTQNIRLKHTAAQLDSLIKSYTKRSKPATK